MKRIDFIMKHPRFIEEQGKIEQLEVDRIFCCHGLNHSLDVARILYIKALEQKCEIKKDVIYAAALLHDIGRAMEYKEGKKHHEAGAAIAREILQACEYGEEEILEIENAILCHKEKVENDEHENTLCKLLYEADKLSRNCFDCKATKQCYWDDEKRNHTVVY